VRASGDYRNDTALLNYFNTFNFIYLIKNNNFINNNLII